MGSMYGNIYLILTYIWLMFIVQGKCKLIYHTMDPMGKGLLQRFLRWLHPGKLT